MRLGKLISSHPQATINAAGGALAGGGAVHGDHYAKKMGDPHPMIAAAFGAAGAPAKAVESARIKSHKFIPRQSTHVGIDTK